MVVEKDKQAAGEKQGRKPWTLREFGGKTLWDWLQLLEVRGQTQGQRGPRGGWEEWQPFVTSVGANFGETRLADIQLPNILRHQDLCTSSSASRAAA